MKKLTVLICVGSIILGMRAPWKDDTRRIAIDKAINKSIPLLEKSSHAFLKNVVKLTNCHSCHNQGLGLITFSMAKERGFAVNDTILQEGIDSTYLQWRTDENIKVLSENDDPLAVIITGNYDLWAFKENNFKPNKLTALIALNIMRRQTYDGSWFSPGQRPPLEYYSFSITALAVKNIQVYAPAGVKDEVQNRVARASQWMINTKPVTHEEKVYQLLGLKWANSDQEFIKQQGKALLATQHGDGGWSQLDSLPTDAYATGQALYVLKQTGCLSATDPAYQRGIDFLLKTQEADGSWYVKTRSYPFVPFVDTEFPHGASQFISAAGSNWATMALLLSTGKRENK